MDKQKLRSLSIDEMPPPELKGNENSQEIYKFDVVHPSISRQVVSGEVVLELPSSPKLEQVVLEHEYFHKSDKSLFEEYPSQVLSILPQIPPTPYKKHKYKHKSYTPSDLWDENSTSIINKISIKNKIKYTTYKTSIIQRYNKSLGIMTHSLRIIFYYNNKIISDIFIKIGKWKSKYRSIENEGEISVYLDTQLKTFQIPKCKYYFCANYLNYHNLGIIVYDYIEDFDTFRNPTNRDRDNLKKSFEELEKLNIIRLDILKNVKVAPNGNIIHFDFECDKIIHHKSYTEIYKIDTLDDFVDIIIEYSNSNKMLPTPDI